MIVLHTRSQGGGPRPRTLSSGRLLSGTRAMILGTQWAYEILLMMCGKLAWQSDTKLELE